MSNQLVKILWLILISMNITGCKLMPYRNDFDCPIPQGLKCHSLYEVNKMADQNMFNPNNNNDKPNFKSRCFEKYNNDSPYAVVKLALKLNVLSSY